ncbi:MAG: hypothetical protein M3O70_00835 [Actinomycetota bacterium]|nr:hypothetical protein [Actinomycetota bacterium]
MNLPRNLSLTTLAGVLAGSVTIGGLTVPGALYLAESRRPIEVTSYITETETVHIPGPVRFVTEYETETEYETVTQYATPRQVPSWKQDLDHEYEHRNLLTPGLGDEVCIASRGGYRWECE